MDKRFFNIFGLTEEQALSILEKPSEELEDKTDRYVAVSHLMNFPTERSIAALIDVVNNDDPDLYNRIARRKAVESLGRLKAVKAIPAIAQCLEDEDCYTVENAVWAIGEMGSEDRDILDKIVDLLEKKDQSYRVIIQSLAKLNYKPAIDSIQKFQDNEDPTLVSTAIAALARLTQDNSQMPKVVEFLQHESVNARRGCIQDLIDANYFQAIPEISRCPVSMVFRLRALRQLGAVAIAKHQMRFAEIEPYLTQVVNDAPSSLEFVHEYDQQPSIDFLIGELYHTDFGRCYLATQTLLESYPKEASEALLATWEKEAHNDYGAHYHVIKLLGWLRYAPAYDLLVEEGLHNQMPQFQKSRSAAAIALGILGDSQAIPLLKETLESPIFNLRYASALALQSLGIDQLPSLEEIWSGE